jgi:hypothetical protein
MVFSGMQARTLFAKQRGVWSSWWDARDLALSRYERRMDLQAFAQADFAHCDIDPVHFIFL